MAASKTNNPAAGKVTREVSKAKAAGDKADRAVDRLETAGASRRRGF